MTITIDASRALHEEPTGIERYAREIILHLLNLREAHDHRWLLLAPHYPGRDHPLASLSAWAHWRIIPGERFWTLWHLSRAIWHEPLLRESILFVPAHTLPFVSPRRTVVTIHDLAFRHFPNAYGRIRWQLNRELKRSVRKASQIIVPSQTTKTDIEHFYHAPADRITVIPHGINHAPVAAALGPNPHQKPYFLFIGRIEYRKNIPRILEAYQLLSQSQPTADDLILIGKPGYGAGEIHRFHESLAEPVRRRIHFLGYQSAERTHQYLRHATAFIFPSLFEGFGFPILEAMAANVPVLTSQTSALGEIAGDAAVVIDPHNTDDIVRGWQLLLEPGKRKDLVRKGNKRVAAYTWEKAADQTLKVLLKTA